MEDSNYISQSAKTIQNFYKVYIKTDRDKENHLPIDPITQDGIPKNKQIPILCFDSKKSIKPIKTQYFHIDTLDTWLKTRRECINPLTNLPFTNSQIQTIIQYYKKYKKRYPNYLQGFINEEIDNDTVQDEPTTIIKQIYESAKNPENIDTFTNLLITNYDKIHNDTIKLDTLFKSAHYFIDSETILMRIVLNDNLAALEEFLYYNPNLEFMDPRFNLKAIDLAVMSNKPLSNMILRTLLFHGARTDIPTKKGYTNELTNDIEKLSILFEFSN